MAASWKDRGIKGLGGFHLACDAANPAAVAELRRRKKRSDKPFALMAFDLNTIRKHCLVSPTEAELLESRRAPVVLLRASGRVQHGGGNSPWAGDAGIYAALYPLHLLLLEPAA
jgi:hydrogenase maturation protein HypF